MKKYLQAFFFSLFLAASLSLMPNEANAQGCVMCRAQVGESKDNDHAKKIGTSLNTGILYLVAIPYILVGTVGFLWYRQYKKNQVA
ncbi:hypothetical protein I5M27_04920 [Adhaeribacter sp. BT258]|uniref:Uncharacterized protein n=1 Tax=Adhaeribacter terrigena TaxID=2793070 RepID=A0ABS1BYY0_9BACT|nr:hypothetical protein [Adhaeribacter terrigena]MBK0402315.1 hypothetical protein [Adhaeribacter terrigena]